MEVFCASKRENKSFEQSPKIWVKKAFQNKLLSEDGFEICFSVGAKERRFWGLNNSSVL